MIWRLLPQLNACIAADRVILLDIERDRYFALPPEIALPTMAWLQSQDGSRPPHQLDALLHEALGEKRVAAGITNLAPAAIAIEPTLPEAGRKRAIGAKAIMSVSLTVGWTWLALRCRRLQTILEKRQRLRASGAKVSLSVLRDRASKFAAARPWCPIPPNCLLDSLAVDQWLGSPANAELVFGVVGHPFEAHSWMQSNGVVLNDSYDRVSRFEPILAI